MDCGQVAKKNIIIPFGAKQTFLYACLIFFALAKTIYGLN